MPISQEFAEKLYDRMQEHINCSLDSEELDILAKHMSSDVMLKAFGLAFRFCKETLEEMGKLDMSESKSAVAFTHGQGQIQGVHTVVNSLLTLIIEKEEEEHDES